MNDTSTSSLRPPIVAVLGHVDHGKTSLLDAIRKTHVTEREAGGITQHIGAYQITVSNKDTKGIITFIDTPGHEAFAKMRARGAQVADIAILVVAASEGVKPQTVESIKYIKAANIPYLVALTKMDLPDVNVDKVKQQLASHEVLVENFGGDIVVVPVSAKTGSGIPQLLDTILLLSGMNSITGDSHAALLGVVIEAKLDKARGPLASVIVKQGVLHTGDTIFAENIEAKVRSMMDSEGNQVKDALPSMPVEIMGWKHIPQVGSVITSKQIEKQAQTQRFQPKAFELPPLETTKKLKLILKADVEGSLEAIKENLGDKVELIQGAVGNITESDIHLAKSTGSFLIGFNVKPSGSLIELAKHEKIRLKTYKIIYELLDELQEVIDFLNRSDAEEEQVGEAQISAEFEINDQRIAGCKVTSGRINKNDMLKLIHRDRDAGRSKIKSLHQGKQIIDKVNEGEECGIVFDKKLDFVVGDRIIAYKINELLS